MGTITCNLGNMAVNATATFVVTVKVNGSGNKTSISNTATASSPSFDPNLANNAATVTTQIYGNKKSKSRVRRRYGADKSVRATRV